ncbi:MAG: hypothetical protein AVO35_02415 [Candidatus Aegiribacteria sp. MLS_C]|nr:MAG: hypothetical protein AVO35_02415 [Candidatus Aegiribacteria sp. MLS_C]
MHNDGWSPAFLVIGAMKAASSWLHGCLIRHPELAGPIGEKELHFFDEPANYRRGLEYYRSLFPDLPGRGMGESTPAYLHAPDVHSRVHRAFPDVRILASLRDPADRAFSHYRYSLFAAGRLSVFPTFEDALDGTDELLDFGRYGAHISRWLTLFSGESIHLVLYEDIKEDPLGIMEEAYRFLRLKDTGFRTDHATEKFHVTGSWRLKVANPGLYRQALKVSMALRKLPLLDRMLRRTGMIRSIRNMLRKGSERVRDLNFREPVYLPETRARIIEEMREDIGVLEGILRRDLSSWKTVERV